MYTRARAAALGAVLFLIMLLVACASPLVYPDQSAQTEPLTDGTPNAYRNPIRNTDFEPQPLYQYFLQNGTLARFNVTTGEVTYLCDDPLCAHREDCLFSDVGLDFSVDEQAYAICFVSDGRLIRYDVASKNAKVLYQIDMTEGAQGDGGAMTSFSHGYFWYRDAYAKVFYRVDLITGVYEQIDPAYDIPIAYIDGRYYCTASGSPVTEVYSLDPSMQNKQTVLSDCILYYVNFDHVTSQSSGYITFSEWCDGELVRYTYDLAAKQKSVSATNQPMGESWDDYVCYTKSVDAPRLMGECGLNGKIYNRTGGTVYRYHVKTDTEEILFSNDDLVIGSPQMIGQYLVYDFGAFVKHEVFSCPYWQTDGGGKLVIDVQTGEYCVYFNTWDNTLTRYQ